MSEEPERIWLQKLDGPYKWDWTWHWEPIGEDGLDEVEYVRADEIRRLRGEISRLDILAQRHANEATRYRTALELIRDNSEEQGAYIIATEALKVEGVDDTILSCY